MDVEVAEAKPLSPVSVSVTARGLELIQDKPEEFGGKNQGMMASELLLGALLGCQHSTFIKIAAKRRADVTIDSIQGEVHFSDAGDISEIRVHFHLLAPLAVTNNQIMQACRLTDKACTISKAMAVPVNWSYERVAPDAPAAKASST